MYLPYCNICEEANDAVVVDACTLTASQHAGFLRCHGSHLPYQPTPSFAPSTRSRQERFLTASNFLRSAVQPASSCIKSSNHHPCLHRCHAQHAWHYRPPTALPSFSACRRWIATGRSQVAVGRSMAFARPLPFRHVSGLLISMRHHPNNNTISHTCRDSRESFLFKGTPTRFTICRLRTGVSAR